MSDEFDPQSLNRLVTEMARIQLAISELLRQNVQIDTQSKVDAREDIDLTSAADKVAVEADSVQESRIESGTGPAPQVFTAPVVDASAPESGEGHPLNLPSLPALEHTEVSQKIDQPTPPKVDVVPPFSVDLGGAALDIPSLPEIKTPEAPVFKHSSAADGVELPHVPVVDFHPEEFKLAQDQVALPPKSPPEQPLPVPPLDFTSSPHVSLDKTTIQSHWEHDLSADAITSLTDFRDESRRWRRGMLAILQMIVDDLRMDNAALESIIRHFELSRRSP